MKSRLAVYIAGLTVAAALTGCGGSGGGSSSLTKKSSPTSTTRARVVALFGGSVRSLTQAGFQTGTFAATENASTVAPTASNAAAGSTTASTSGSGTGIPLVGAFLRSIDTAPATRAQRIVRRHGRDVAVGVAIAPSPTPVGPTTDFYYDYYLGLWVATTETSSQSTYLLYADQAETQPAGSIVTIWPADYTVYPQTYSSTYSFTAGYLAGSHGSSNDVTNADGSSTSTYSDSYSDGSSDSGTSVYTASGTSTWTSSTIASDGSTTTYRGTFNSDGSGATHTEMSDGYVADYTFNADGSGSGKITGPDPGLPATIKWDIYGDTNITFADGSGIYYPGWSSINDEVVPATTTGSGSSGSSGSSSGSSGSGTTVSSPPVTSTSPPAAIGI